MTEREYLLKKLPPFKNKQILIEAQQEIPDIVNEVLEAHDYFLEDYTLIADYFNEATTEKILKKLFDFCKNNILYKVESENEQTTKSAGAILTTQKGDCKHYAGFIAGNIAALQMLTGKKINWFYRFASYRLSDKEPAHVFVVVKNAGREIWIDPVLKEFNSRAILPQNWIDYKINNETMSLKRIAGLEDQNLIEAAKEIKFYGIVNPQGQVIPAAYVYAMQNLPFEQRNSLGRSVQLLQSSLTNNSIGSFFGDLWDGVKTVLFGGGDQSNSNLQNLQMQLSNCQMQLNQANQNKNSLSQYLPILLIGGVAIYFLMKK